MIADVINSRKGTGEEGQAQAGESAQGAADMRMAEKYATLQRQYA
jgi:hypothetical protein